MKKILIIVMAICCLAVKANAQLLYKVSGDSLKPSFIVASHPYINPLGVVDNVTAIKIKSSRMLLATGFLRKVFEILGFRKFRK